MTAQRAPANRGASRRPMLSRRSIGARNAGLVLLLALLLVSACSGETADDLRDQLEGALSSTLPDGESGPPATEPPATEPPATEPPATEPPATEPPATEPPATEPPATTPPAADEQAAEDDSNDLLIPIVLLLVAVAALLVWALTRRGTDQDVQLQQPAPPSGPPPSAWSQRARSAYTSARWLHDSMDERAAMRMRQGAGSEQVRQTLAGIEQRQSAALTELYGLEADAPTAAARVAAQDAASAVRDLRSTFDALTEPAPPGGADASATGPTEAMLTRDLQTARSRLSQRLDTLAETIRMMP